MKRNILGIIEITNRYIEEHIKNLIMMRRLRDLWNSFLKGKSEKAFLQAKRLVKILARRRKIYPLFYNDAMYVHRIGKEIVKIDGEE